MRPRPQRITSAQRRRLALAGFLAGGVLAVLVNQDAPTRQPTDTAAQHAGQPSHAGMNTPALPPQKPTPKPTTQDN
ncbi:MAG: hypothetical protein ACIAXF_09980 [Phycisphaerales bacterium JB063]